MRYEIAVDGHACEVEILSLEDGRFRARVDGRDVSGTFLPGSLVLAGGESVEYAADRDDSGQPRQVVLRGRAQDVAVLSMGFRRRSGGPGAAAAGSGAVVAPMNGQVVKVLASAGDDVQAGQVVVVLEAMKMENEVTAPRSGRLARLEVRVGEAVHPGHLLFEIGSDEPV